MKRYTIENHSLEAGGVLLLEVDCAEHARGYRVEWNVVEQTMAMACHWQDDSGEQTFDLDPSEVRELELWIARSRRVTAVLEEYAADAALYDDTGE